MYRRVAILLVVAALFFGLGFLARPTLHRWKHRARAGLQKDNGRVQVIDVTHYERMSAHYASLGETKPIVFLGDSRIEWAEWGDLLGRSDISNRGISGDTTDGVLQRLSSSVPSAGVICVIQLGVNNLFLATPVDRVVDNYRRILDHLITEKQARVILTSVVLAGAQYGELNRQIVACNEQLARLAASTGATWLDLNSALATNGHLAEEFSDDGVHFNARGYRTISDLIAPQLPR